MKYADMLRRTFPDLAPEVDDLFLLEAHQIAQLPERAPERELAVVLHAHPRIGRFLKARYPPIGGYVDLLLGTHPASEADLHESEQELLWEIADLIVYQRAPELYAEFADDEWVLDAITDLTSLEGKVVIDAGAGTGRVSFRVARQARHVFAVEPVASLRDYLRARAVELGNDNVFVLDGTLGAIPLPAGTADVLVTCRAIGWSLPEELVEIERVVNPGGLALHLGMPHPVAEDDTLHERLVAAGYDTGTYDEGGSTRIRYWKRL